MAQKVTYLLDTNIIVRFFVGDNPSQAKKAASYFKKAEKGEINLVVKPLVIAEACFVLESFYKKSREDIASGLQVFLAQKWLVVDDRQILQNIWPTYLDGHHFVDGYLFSVAIYKKYKVLSFDKKLLKLIS